MPVAHENLPDSELHNPKGFASAASNTVPHRTPGGALVWDLVDTDQLETGAVTSDKLATDSVGIDALSSAARASAVAVSSGTQQAAYHPDHITKTGATTGVSILATVPPTTSGGNETHYAGGFLVHCAGTLTYHITGQVTSGADTPDVTFFRQRPVSGTPFLAAPAVFATASSAIATSTFPAGATTTRTQDIDVQVGDIVYVGVDAETRALTIRDIHVTSATGGDNGTLIASVWTV